MQRKLPQSKQVGKGSPVADAVSGGFLANRYLPLFHGSLVAYSKLAPINAFLFFSDPAFRI